MPRPTESFELVDGRQSPTALLVARGTRRLLRSQGFSTVTELPLLSGRRADIVALSAKGTISIVEIKSSVADYRADSKWPEYLQHCDRFYFAIPQDFPSELIPVESGLIIADAYGANIMREPAEFRIPASTRKAVLLRFASAAADRLHRLADPELDAGLL